MSNPLHNLLASRGILGDKDADECMTWAANEIENLQAERDELLEFARRIGKIVGCGHADNAGDQNRLVACVRESVSKLPEVKLRELAFRQLKLIGELKRGRWDHPAAIVECRTEADWCAEQIAVILSAETES